MLLLVAQVKGGGSRQHLVVDVEGIQPGVTVEAANKPVSVASTVCGDLNSLARNTVSRVDGNLGPCSAHISGCAVLVNKYHIFATISIFLNCDGLRASSRATLLQIVQARHHQFKHKSSIYVCNLLMKWFIPCCPCPVCFGHMPSCYT